MTIAQVPKNFPIRIYHSDNEYKWYWQYEYKGDFWEGFGFDSEKEALEFGIKYVTSQLLAHKRQAQQRMEEASSCLEQLNCAEDFVENHRFLDLGTLNDFQKWKKANSDKFSLWDYLSGVANIEIAIAFTKLFWPDFVEYEGGIFLSEAFSSQLHEQWKIKLRNDVAGIEQVINHQHVDDILPGAQNASSENLLYLGQALAQMWESRLKLLYPQRRFQVKCDRDENTVVVTFFQNN